MIVALPILPIAARVLGIVNDASRHLRWWPSAIVDGPCERWLWQRQVGTKKRPQGRTKKLMQKG